MTRWQAFIVFICIAHTTSGQNTGCISVELTEAFRSANAKVGIGYTISGQWSAEARSSFHICDVRPDTEMNNGNRTTIFEMAFRHWGKECYKGGYVSLGVIAGFRKEADLRIGFGYSLPVWKCIGIDIGYGFNAIHAIRQKATICGEIALEIHYLF